ncbi:MAG TPA: thioredoxin family protein [Cyanobacteria bacterium UBA11149]|nr:thioredoxin family protein [Cyanobacteria bacterium UBA11367]HBE60548.1 thioredoxin family protein [Cyanobacteria bacterium UBA11366]HBK63778.1 thioredoxin family protein [Cyanobacteria bacterium UBA11166]HBR72884.1 thioredoxin family protein [Cyanobacteria bacterium UBA11159]HBS68997.1 thioredoxin family protein [Cyanobacteria bacterium UBA11153]HBW89598.1 thioredoxin family protein [Cyanobacteria bacterium UBA11149]HCA93387.1 thioredoxin family protein [Cyanobacteria bacterium UBA9226]
MSLIEKIGTPIGSYAPDFELPGIDGEVHHLSSYLRKWRGVVVIFMSNQCPFVSSYLSRLKQIQSQFKSRGITLVGINANDVYQYPKDSFDTMKKFAKENKLNFPYLWDPTQDVAQGFGAEKTPEVFLIDKTGILCYRGQIDDRPDGGEGERVPYLENAIAALLAGAEVSPKSTAAIGSNLQWRD